MTMYSQAGDEAIEEVDMEEDALDIDEQGDQPTIKRFAVTLPS